VSDQFVGEIRWFTYPRGAPSGWVLCDGRLLSISEYEVLYTLLGTTYGGNGIQTFAVPDLRSRVPLHQGNGPGLTPRVLGQVSGTEGVTLTGNQLGGHSHVLIASTSAATTANASTMMLAQIGGGDTLYLSANSGATAYPLLPCVGAFGGNQPHENCAPTLPLNPCIAFVGVFPTQS